MSDEQPPNDGAPPFEADQYSNIARMDPSTQTAPTNNINNGNEQQQEDVNLLRTAMLVADVIRRHELQQQATTTTTTTTDDNKPLLPQETRRSAVVTDNDETPSMKETIVEFLETPGVKQGCITASCCLAAFLPTRRLLLRIADQRLNLGRVFPDLIVTPPLVLMGLVQLPLFAGTLYGSRHYLQRLAEIPVDAPSPTADAICNDPLVVAAAITESEAGSTKDISTATASSDSSASSWDPRQQTIHALQEALQNCRERRNRAELLQATTSTETTVTEESTERISWWKKR